ncbi:unnamed protein product [Eruca vesicaria subsp. sativa]|uniref:MADS-box domain-containing protein n=1 Tax=Eruca vesicaria subsp. sativa TaxID=29727 RepID=A0ABC8ITZ6_ERUVS|nr:unnamed protein product [Eruca vesicaria subsp. sativa]
MRPPLSSSSSSYSLAETSFKSRLLTIFKKSQELTTLCDIEVCVIHYGPDGELKKWSEDRDKVRSLALRYIQLDKAKRLKKSVNLYDFLIRRRRQLMPYGGYDQNMMCMGNNFHAPYVSSNTPDHSVFPPELHEAVSNHGLNQLMQLA